MDFAHQLWGKFNLEMFYPDLKLFLDQSGTDNLKTGVLTIGPFDNMPDAEEAKRVYRLH